MILIGPPAILNGILSYFLMTRLVAPYSNLDTYPGGAWASWDWAIFITSFLKLQLIGDFFLYWVTINYSLLTTIMYVYYPLSTLDKISFPKLRKSLEPYKPLVTSMQLIIDSILCGTQFYYSNSFYPGLFEQCTTFYSFLYGILCGMSNSIIYHVLYSNILGPQGTPNPARDTIPMGALPQGAPHPWLAHSCRHALHRRDRRDPPGWPPYDARHADCATWSLHNLSIYRFTGWRKCGKPFRNRQPDHKLHYTEEFSISCFRRAPRFSSQIQVSCAR